MTCTLRSILSSARNRGPAWFLLGFVLLFALPAFAQTEDQDPTLDAPARFLIETITVEGIDRPATREIVVEESRIHTGLEVDEDQLRLAIYRVRRLPFVIDADFSLRKGSERGRYELVIRIEMASSIVADLGATWYEARSVGFITGFDGSATVGARKFIGSRGYAFGSIDENGNLNVGYTQFHLFGPGSYLSAVGSTDVNDGEPGYRLSLTAGKPLTATQSLRGSVAYLEVGVESFREARGQTGFLEWRFDSTDDPLLPTEGASVSVSALGVTSKSRIRVDGTVLSLETRSWSVGALARRYWPLASRHSIWGELSAAHLFAGLDLEQRSNPNDTGTASVGYSWDLIRSQVGAPRNDLRFTTGASYSLTSHAFDQGFYGRVLVLDARLIYRRAQGSVSLAFSYAKPFDQRRLF
ncbi:MAG TPA: hypothetical protein VN851_02995 [Thermoanaerobaculia bacterium]|nr:hypothetical protein [Thermoanaerobaculia bacterium]